MRYLWIGLILLAGVAYGAPTPTNTPSYNYVYRPDPKLGNTKMTSIGDFRGGVTTNLLNVGGNATIGGLANLSGGAEGTTLGLTGGATVSSLSTGPTTITNAAGTALVIRNSSLTPVINIGTSGSSGSSFGNISGGYYLSSSNVINAISAISASTSISGIAFGYYNLTNSGGITVNLGAQPFERVFIMTTANPVTLVCSGSTTFLDGTSSYVLTKQYEWIKIFKSSVSTTLNYIAGHGIGLEAYNNFTNPVSVANTISNQKSMMTTEGGYASLLTNKTGTTSVKGQLVSVSPTTANAVTVAPANDNYGVGVMYSSGVADGSSVWVVHAGIADVNVIGPVTLGTGYIRTGATAGVAVFDTDTSIAQHNQEFGHPLEATANTYTTSIKCMIHWN